MRRRHILGRTLWTGALLLLSTHQIAFQDAVSLVSSSGDFSGRWQARVVAAPEIDRSKGTTLRTAALIGPGIVRKTLVPIDPIVTGSVAAAPKRYIGVNRIAKADILVARPAVARSPLNAGLLKTVALFAPVETEGALPKTAFAMPEVPKVAVAEATPPSPKAQMAAIKPPAKPVVVAYAETDDATEKKLNAPFAAVMGKARVKQDSIVLDPNIDANHRWVNDKLPASVRSAAEQKCLATAIYFEARGEPERGRIAVAQVVLNRVKNPTYPDTICNVVYQNKNFRNRCQFSFACDGIKDRITNAAAWRQATTLAKRVVTDDRTLFLADVGSSTHYHANYVKPRWARHMKKMKKIGRHIFYKTYGGGWS